MRNVSGKMPIWQNKINWFQKAHNGLLSGRILDVMASYFDNKMSSNVIQYIKRNIFFFNLLMGIDTPKLLIDTPKLLILYARNTKQIVSIFTESAVVGQGIKHSQLRCPALCNPDTAGSTCFRWWMVCRHYLNQSTLSNHKLDPRKSPNGIWTKVQLFLQRNLIWNADNNLFRP